MGRSPCCTKLGLKRGPWTSEEDALLSKYIEEHGEGNWRLLPKAAGLWRCGKSCRLRWINYLRPDLKRGNISEDEEQLIITLHTLLGNRWSLIAGRIPGRTDNEIKNYWNTHLRKKLANKAKEPSTKKPLHQRSFFTVSPRNSAESKDDHCSSPKCWPSLEQKLPELHTDASHGNTGVESDVSWQGKNSDHVQEVPAAIPNLLSSKVRLSSQITPKVEAAFSIRSRSEFMNHVDTITSQSSGAVSPSSSAISVTGHHAAASPCRNNLPYPASRACSLEAEAVRSASTRGCSKRKLVCDEASDPPAAITRSFEAEAALPGNEDVPLSVDFYSSDIYNDNINNTTSSSGGGGGGGRTMSFDDPASDIYNIIADFLPATNCDTGFLEQLQNLEFLQTGEPEMEVNNNFWEPMSWLTADSWELF